MKTRLFIFGLILALATPLALADEGMWLYNNFPKDRVEKQYGFLPTQEWLDHLRLSSVRFNNGGSGSFVSADGLAFTNHHVGADCIEKLGTSGADVMIGDGPIGRHEREPEPPLLKRTDDSRRSSGRSSSAESRIFLDAIFGEIVVTTYPRRRAPGALRGQE